MRRLIPAAWILAVAFSGTACYTMRPISYEQLGVARPGAVYITRPDQSVVVLETPRVFGDTLVGYIKGEFQELSKTELNPQLYRVRQMAGVRTAALVTAAAVGAGTFVFLVSGAGRSVNPEDTRDCEDDPYQAGCPLAPPGT
jgi:hypothetical protein